MDIPSLSRALAWSGWAGWRPRPPSSCRQTSAFALPSEEGRDVERRDRLELGACQELIRRAVWRLGKRERERELEDGASRDRDARAARGRGPLAGVLPPRRVRLPVH